MTDLVGRRMMALTADHFLMPLAVVNKLIKDVLPENVEVSADAKKAISRASSVFVLVVTRTCQMYNPTGVVHAQGILDTLDSHMKLDEFVAPLMKFHDDYRKKLLRKLYRLKKKEQAKKLEESKEKQLQERSRNLNESSSSSTVSVFETDQVSDFANVDFPETV